MIFQWYGLYLRADTRGGTLAPAEILLKGHTKIGRIIEKEDFSKIPFVGKTPQKILKSKRSPKRFLLREKKSKLASIVFLSKSFVKNFFKNTNFNMYLANFS